MVLVFPLMLGIIGTPTWPYSFDLYNARAQKWGGVHKNMIKNISQGIELPNSVTEENIDPRESTDTSRDFSDADHPTRGGVEPAIPPITIFWGVDLFSHML